MLGYDLKIACAKFQENWFIIDREIDERHALQNYQNKCGPGYNLIIIDLMHVIVCPTVEDGPK